MSTERNQLITCDLCKRRYNINVYKRHINENQCIKRNQHRLPFESIKQRSIQIGDQILSVQKQQQQKKTNDGQISNNREQRTQQISNNNNNKRYQEKNQKILPSNNRRRTLEQAKELLEKRTKYKPPWIQKRSNHFQSKLNQTNTANLQVKDSSYHAVDQRLSPKKTIQTLYSHQRPSPPTTKFKNDDLPINVSDRQTLSEKPVSTHSPKIRNSKISATSKYQSNRVDQTFSHEQTTSAARPMRKAYTWTRSSKQSSIRDVISPIHIPTFRDSSSGPSHDRVPIPLNQNYDDDEFERYSPTPPSTPKYKQDKTDIKNNILSEQQTILRPATYQKAKTSEQQHQNESKKNTQSTFHLPPIKPSFYPKIKPRSILNPSPWR